MDQMKITALSLLLIILFSVCFTACSSEEWEINGDNKTLATRTTRSVGEETFMEGEVWIADASAPDDHWKFEICPGCWIVVGYSWSGDEFYPNNKCVITSNAHIDHPWPSNLIVNNETIVKNLKTIQDIRVTENPVSWMKRRKYGARIAFDGEMELLCSYEDTSIVKDSQGRDSVINKGHDKDITVTISNIHAERDIPVHMHLKDY